MDHLPDETIMHILEFVPDKIYASMVCKRWGKLLNDMYKNNKNQILGDVYYLQKYYYEYGYECCTNHIPSIKNHQCLNFLCYIIKEKKYWIQGKLHIQLLLQNCKTNNVSKPQDIRFLSGTIEFDVSNVAFDNKSYDILAILSLNYNIVYVWTKIYSAETDINILIEHINMFIDKCISNWMGIYKNVNQSMFTLKNELLEYLYMKMPPDILRLIK
jgi:hypothetical protein